MVAVRSWTAGLALACLVAFGLSPASNALVAGGSGQATSLPTLIIDAGVTDGSGRSVTTIRPEDLRVTVDGTPRQVVSLRYVCRGPGAEVAAALVARAGNAAAAAERSRLLLLLADENAIAQAQQRAVTAVVSRMLDELGTADQAAVATLPRPPTALAFGTVAAEWQTALARVVGRAATSTLASGQPPPRPLSGAVDPNAGAQGGVTADDLARLELSRQAATNRRAAQDDSAEGPIDLGPGASLRALRAVLDSLAQLPGPKSVLVFRHADSVTDTPAPDSVRNLTPAVLASAARARVAVHVVTVGQARRKRTSGDDEMSAIALATGGAIGMPKDASDTKALDGVRAALEGGYLIEVEGREGDGPTRQHDVRVECIRRETIVRSPRQWVSRSDPLPTGVVAAPGGAALPGAEPRASRRIDGNDAQLTLLLARLSEYLAAYVRGVQNVVAEEDYTQRATRRDGSREGRRVRSDLLLVRTNADTGWTQYRDAFEVDGQPVRDREQRVQKLFLENPAMASRLAEQISNESARYNVGTLTRTINTPLLALAYLMPARINGLSFRREGEETVEGIRAARLEFEEKGRPTLVHPVTGPGDVPANGTFWVDPASGRILMTRITVLAGRNQMTTTVVYKPSVRLGLWLPAQMDERSSQPSEEVEGRALYSNYRSFKVTSDVTIRK